MKNPHSHNCILGPAGGVTGTGGQPILRRMSNDTPIMGIQYPYYLDSSNATYYPQSEVNP
jgi:hypothetical protein